MAKKKVEHVVFDGMRKVRKEINISEFNKNAHVEKRKYRDAGIKPRFPTFEEHHKDR